MKTTATSAPTRIRVLVADSHPVVRYGLASSLSQEHDIDVVGDTASGDDTVHLIASLQTDVVILGSSFTDHDGIHIAKALRDRYENLGIVIFAELVDDAVLFRALDSGASAFVTNDALIPELVAAVRHAAIAAGSFTSAGLADAMRRQRETPEPTMLSTREQQVLGLLFEGYSIPALARELHLSHSTAKTYVSRVYEKFGVNNRANAIVHAMQSGLIHVGPSRVKV
jgi:DNA-binding NarL/FixJ family response regulator